MYRRNAQRTGCIRRAARRESFQVEDEAILTSKRRLVDETAEQQPAFCRCAAVVVAIRASAVHVWRACCEVRGLDFVQHDGPCFILCIPDSRLALNALASSKHSLTPPWRLPRITCQLPPGSDFTLQRRILDTFNLCGLASNAGRAFRGHCRRAFTSRVLV